MRSGLGSGQRHSIRFLRQRQIGPPITNSPLPQRMAAIKTEREMVAAILFMVAPFMRRLAPHLPETLL